MERRFRLRNILLFCFEAMVLLCSLGWLERWVETRMGLLVGKFSTKAEVSQKQESGKLSGF